jgi:undecaprenyl-diphosphatase
MISRRAGLLVLLASAAPLFSSLLKLILGPVPLDALAYSPASAASFPSGHVAYATGLLGYIAVLTYRHKCYLCCGCALAVVVMMGPVRVLSGTHLPSDVLGGYAIGGGWLAIVLSTERRTPA